MTTPTTVQVRFQFRADTAANWTTIDPVLLANELARETDTGKIKIGDGTTAWSSLAYQGWSTLTYPLVNADIASDAAIAHSKLAEITAGSVLLGDASNVPTATALSGDVIVNSSGVTAISAGAIVDADVSASAEIAVSKLANGTANQILTTDGTDVTWTDSPTIAGNVIITGNLTVNGTETIINVDTLQVEDKTIEMGNVTTPTDLTADGGGIVLKGATDKTITWSDTTDAWTSSELLDLPAGAEATPALFFGGDVNSGLYSPGADQVAISTGGTGRFFVNANGRVGVGAAADDSAQFRSLTGTSGKSWTAPTGTTALFERNSINYVTIAAANNNTSQLNFADTDDADIGNIKYNHSEDSLAFGVNNSERLRLTSTGEFEFKGAGTAGTTQAVYFSGSAPVDSLVVNATGDVGVGVASPLARFHIVNGTDANAIAFISGEDTTSEFMSLGVNPGEAVLTAGGSGSTSTDLVIRTASSGAESEKVRIDSSGRLLVGTPTSTAVAYNVPAIIQTRFSSSNVAISAIRENGGAIIALGRANGSGSEILANNDSVGEISFAGADGTDLRTPVARINAEVDGTPGADDMPGRLIFSTTADGSSSPTERLRISSDGSFGLSGANYGTSGQVLTSNGSSAAPTWQNSGGALFTSYAIIADQKAQGTDGGTFTAAGWRIRDLNTELYDPDGIVSISSNEFTLDAGTYFIEWAAPGFRCNSHMSRLYDVTGDAVVQIGQNAFTDTSADGDQTNAFGWARVTITASNAYRIEHYAITGGTTRGFGNASNIDVETYTVVKIFKEG